MVHQSTITELSGGKTTNSYNDLTGTHRLLRNIVEGKEYCLSTGRHTAIIRKKGANFEYLELQSDEVNGWKPLDDKVLIDRFRCKKTHNSKDGPYRVPNFLIDVDALKGVSAFEEMLGYINTAV